ncbi:MAG: DMT family transporter [Hyphomicrobiales bacterium]|nr:DMT family transporter [Hyphomicrobiales bacterium]
MTGKKPGPGDYGLLLALAAIWGSSFLFIKLSVETVPAASATAIRLAIAALVMSVVAFHARQSIPRDARIWGLILLAGLFGNAAPFTLISWGEEVIDSGLAAILMAVMPLTTVLLAHFLFADERATITKAIGVIFGIAGLVVLIGPQKLLQLGDNTVRQLAVAAAAACYGINAVVTRSLMGLPHRALAAAILTASFVMLVPFALYVDRPWTVVPSALSLSSIVILAIAQTVIATFMMFAIIARQGASFFSQINFLVPLFGVFWGVVLLAEHPPGDAYIALALILIGIAIARRSRPAAQE